MVRADVPLLLLLLSLAWCRCHVSYPTEADHQNYSTLFSNAIHDAKRIHASENRINTVVHTINMTRYSEKAAQICRSKIARS